MLMPDNIRPENSIYYTGSLLLKALLANGNQSVDTLFGEVNKMQKMSYNVFLLSLDWLYLLGAAEVKNEEVQLCTSNG